MEIAASNELDQSTIGDGRTFNFEENNDCFCPTIKNEKWFPKKAFSFLFGFFLKLRKIFSEICHKIGREQNEKKYKGNYC